MSHRYPYFLTVLLGAALCAAWAAPSRGHGGAQSSSVAPMLKKATPGVVNIATEGRIRPRGRILVDPHSRRFYNIPAPERKFQSLGSGVIVDAARGLVLTNNHVIANADQITVTLLDGRTLEGEIVGADPGTDVAVIRIAGDDLVELPRADADRLRIGDFVVAIGNPFGLGHSATHGMVSALYRSGLNLLNYENFIQTDAPINLGNSGGALVNLQGELVGINTAIFSNQERGGSVGIGFAIPIDQAMQVMEQILKYGKVRRGYLGVRVQDLSPQLAEAFGLQKERGPVVTEVFPGSPAAEAGLQLRDIILEVNGKAVENSGDLRNAVGLMQPGEAADFRILRAGGARNLQVRIRAAEASPGERRARAETPRARNRLLSGVVVGNDTAGVRLTRVERGTPAWSGGLRPGDVILAVNQRPVRNVDEFLRAADRQPTLLLRVARGNTILFLYIR